MESGIRHYSVMADEMEHYLLGEHGANGTYCDCTAGSGGHSFRILARARGSRLVAIDRDAAALERCHQRLRGFGERVQYFQGGFSRIGEAVQERLPLAGIVADLGLSRRQLDDPGRGFSFQSEGPLDMRFDRRQDTQASDIVNRASERELADLLFQLADERCSRRIARAIVRARPVRDTRHLAELVAGAVPRAARRGIHPATRTFQALRMAVNDELGELAALLAVAPGLLADGGRFVVISFHSGEDRMVKRSFRSLTVEGTYELLTRRVVRPSADEVCRNPPSRSARLRAVCRARGTGTQS